MEEMPQLQFAAFVVLIFSIDSASLGKLSDNSRPVFGDSVSSLSFNYETTVTTDSILREKESTYSTTLTCGVDIKVLYNKDNDVVGSVTISDVAEHVQNRKGKNPLQGATAYFHWHSGSLAKVYVAPKTIDRHSLNVLRGILRLVSPRCSKSELHQDIFGSCHCVEKDETDAVVKQLSNCTNWKLRSTRFHPSVLDSEESHLSETKTVWKDASTIAEVTATEEHIFAPNLLRSQKTQPDKIFQQLLGSLKTPATTDATSAFLTAVQMLRAKASAKQLVGLLKNQSLLDVLVAMENDAALGALRKFADFSSKKHIELLEHVLLALSFHSRPSNELLLFLSDSLRNTKFSSEDTKLKQSLALTLGSICHAATKTGVAKDTVASVATFFQEEYSKCSADGCRIMFLRAIGNLLSPTDVEWIEFVIQQLSSDSLSLDVRLVAVQALRRVATAFTQQHRIKLIELATDPLVNIGLRGVATQTLLEAPEDVSDHELQLLLSSLSQTTEKQYQFGAFVWKLILSARERAPPEVELSKRLGQLLEDGWLRPVGSWLRHNATSNVLRSYLFSSKLNSADFVSLLEFAPSGIMRHSATTVSLAGDNQSSIHRFPLFTFELSADGLESLTGAETGEEGEPREPAAGMALAIRDVLLRPVEFFRGSSGLMSAVWNAPSEPITALATNMLLQDIDASFVLGNGATLHHSSMAAFSLQVSGAVSISLWNRNSESLVRNLVAVVVDNEVEVNMGPVADSLSSRTVTEGEGYMDFTTNVDFSDDPLKLCLQMDHPNLDLWHRGSNTLTIIGKKKGRRIKRWWQKNVIPGRSFKLHPSTSEFCDELVSKKTA